MSDSVTADRLRELLAYDAKTGQFFRLTDGGRGVKAGEVAGCIQKSSGYRYISLDGKRMLAHRLAWLHFFGEWPKRQIDHINGVRDDNSIGNLRDVSISVNQQNRRKASANNLAGFLGVRVHKRTGRYTAAIRVDGPARHIGYFSTAEEAHSAYIQAKREYHEGCTI